MRKRIYTFVTDQGDNIEISTTPKEDGYEQDGYVLKMDWPEPMVIAFSRGDWNEFKNAIAAVEK